MVEIDFPNKEDKFIFLHSLLANVFPQTLKFYLKIIINIFSKTIHTFLFTDIQFDVQVFDLEFYSWLFELCVKKKKAYVGYS